MRSALGQGTILGTGPKDGMTGGQIIIIIIGMKIGKEGKDNSVTWIGWRKEKRKDFAIRIKIGRKGKKT